MASVDRMNLHTSLPALACAPGGCAHLHESVAVLPWKDHWGERGVQLMARDYAMYENLVKQRPARALYPRVSLPVAAACGSPAPAG